MQIHFHPHPHACTHTLSLTHTHSKNNNKKTVYTFFIKKTPVGHRPIQAHKNTTANLFLYLLKLVLLKKRETDKDQARQQWTH